MEMIYLLIIITFSTSMTSILATILPNFDRCKEFFLKGTPPNISYFTDNDNYAIICQDYSRPYQRNYFATLYDTDKRIPVYSAYKLERAAFTDSCKRPQRAAWRTENDLRKDQQAADQDYKHNSIYNRGHLCPSCYLTKPANEATFTLTNIVPQVIRFNGDDWADLEGGSKAIMKEHCNFTGAEMYFVTGALTRHNHDRIPSSDPRVAIPEMLWTVACCSDIKKINGFSFAYYGFNKQSYTGRSFVCKVNDIETMLGHGANLFPTDRENCQNQYQRQDKRHREQKPIELVQTNERKKEVSDDLKIIIGQQPVPIDCNRDPQQNQNIRERTGNSRVRQLINYIRSGPSAIYNGACSLARSGYNWVRGPFG